MPMRSFLFGVFVLAGGIVVAAVVAPDALFSVFTGQPTGMISSDCPPARAKERRGSCLQGPFAGTKLDNKISDAIKNFDED
jgi:hypothetical protein